MSGSWVEDFNSFQSSQGTYVHTHIHIHIHIRQYPSIYLYIYFHTHTPTHTHTITSQITKTHLGPKYRRKKA